MSTLALVLTLLVLSAEPLSAQDSFFAGKTIRIVVGLPAGDAYDTYARILATYMGKHIPGNPTLMVQNMPGASSMITANYVYNVAKPDGLTFGSVLPSLYFDQLLGRKEVKFDWRKYSWLGSFESSNNLIYMRTDTPFKTIHDVTKATEPPKCGSTGTGSPSYFLVKLLNEAIGTKFTVRHRLSGRPGDRPRRRARRSGLPRLYRHDLLRPRAVSHLAQARLCPGAGADRQETGSAPSGRADGQ